MTDVSGTSPQRWLVTAFWAALALYLSVLPIAGTIALRYLAFVVLVASTALLLVRTRMRPVLPFAYCWLAYLLVALVSVFFAVDPEMSMGEWRVEVLYLIAVLVVGVAWGRYLPDFGRVVLLLATVNAILTLAAFYFASLDMSFSAILRIPRFAYAGMDGNWLLAAIFLYAWLAWREWSAGQKLLPILLVALIVLDVWAMMATQNRQNLVALGIGIATTAGLVLSSGFTWRRAGFLFCMMALVTALIAVQMFRRESVVTSATGVPQLVIGQNSSSHPLSDSGAVTSADLGVRLQLWKFSVGKIVEHPWIGGGIGRAVFDKLYPEFMAENPSLWHAHNMILNKGIQMGIPGILAFLALWAGLALELWRHRDRPGQSRNLAIAGIAIVAAVFGKNMTDDYFVRNVALFFWLIMGLMIGALRSAKARTMDSGQ